MISPWRRGGLLNHARMPSVWSISPIARHSAGPRPSRSRNSGGVALGGSGPAAGGESHQRGVEVDVGGGLLGAGGVAGELVLVAGPGSVGDLLFDAGAQHDGELGR